MTKAISMFKIFFKRFLKTKHCLEEKHWNLSKIPPSQNKPYLTHPERKWRKQIVVGCNLTETDIQKERDILNPRWQFDECDEWM